MTACGPPDALAPLREARVLVTGATGFIGGALLGRLRSEGIRVRAVLRSEAAARRLADSCVEAVVGDITDPRCMAAALDGVGIVFHLAGKLFAPGVPSQEYRRTHVEGTRVLLECCRSAPHLTRMVHCSTTGVLGVTGDQPADERTSFCPTNAYESTKAAAELLVHASSDEGIPAVIVRPGLVYGPGDLHLAEFFRAVLHRRFRPIGRQKVWLHPIYVDDLIEGILRCSTHPAALGECFNMAGPEHVSLEYLGAAIAHALGTTLPSGRIPLPAARALATLGDTLPPPLRRSAPLTTSRLDFLTHSRVYNIEKAREVLGFAASTRFDTGVAATVDWYRQQGRLPAGTGS